MQRRHHPMAINDHDDELHEAQLSRRASGASDSAALLRAARCLAAPAVEIAINGSYFNTQRILEQYVLKAYFPERRPVSSPALILALAYQRRLVSRFGLTIRIFFNRPETLARQGASIQ